MQGVRQAVQRCGLRQARRRSQVAECWQQHPAGPDRLFDGAHSQQSTADQASRRAGGCLCRRAVAAASSPARLFGPRLLRTLAGRDRCPCVSLLRRCGCSAAALAPGYAAQEEEGQLERVSQRQQLPRVAGVDLRQGRGGLLLGRRRRHGCLLPGCTARLQQQPGPLCSPGQQRHELGAGLLPQLGRAVLDCCQHHAPLQPRHRVLPGLLQPGSQLGGVKRGRRACKRRAALVQLLHAAGQPQGGRQTLHGDRNLLAERSTQPRTRRRLLSSRLGVHHRQ